MNKFLYNAEALIHLADILHKVLSLRGRWQACGDENEKDRNIDKEFEKRLSRLHKSIDYRAKRAEKLLKCKITDTQPNVNNTMYINICRPHKKSK